jgi:hypothetical protein
VPNKPYDPKADPNRWFRVEKEDRLGRPTHHEYHFLTCKVCGMNYRPGLYATHKKRPEHVAKMRGHRKVTAVVRRRR